MNFTYVGTYSKNWGFFGVKAESIDAILNEDRGTGMGMISGLVGLKFLLKMPHKQTIDLCEQVVVCSNLA